MDKLILYPVNTFVQYGPTFDFLLFVIYRLYNTKLFICGVLDQHC